MSIFFTGLIANLFKVHLTEEIMNSYRVIQKVINYKELTFSDTHYSFMLELFH